MHRVLAFLSSPVSALLLFCMGLLLFSWPLLSIQGERGGTSLVLYIFVSWAALVVLLIARGIALGRANDPDRKR